MAAGSAAQAQESVNQDAAFEEGVELLFDEPGQLGAGAGLVVGDAPPCPADPAAQSPGGPQTPRGKGPQPQGLTAPPRCRAAWPAACVRAGGPAAPE